MSLELLPSLTVNETIERWRVTHAVLNAWGVDTCCGGASTLAEVAPSAGITVDELIDALDATIASGIEVSAHKAPASRCKCGCSGH